MSKKKFYLVMGLVVALMVNIAIFAYTWPNATATVEVAASGEIAPLEASTAQPDWDSLLPVEGGAGTVTLRPNAPGDDTELPTQFPNTGEHWDKVDDTTPDDGATYVSTLGSGGWERDLYNLDDPAVTGDEEISSLTVYFRFSADGSNTARAMASIKTEDQLFDGPTEVYSDPAFADFSHQWQTNPATGEAWTWDEINSLQAGVTMKGQNQNKAAVCTQVYVEVNYQIPPITQGEVPEGDLFDITTNPDYSGDLLVTLYLTNTGALRKAYQYLNIKVLVAGSLEADEIPGYQVLSMENGVVFFNIEWPVDSNYTVEVIGGGYRLTSDDPGDWGAGASITPEIYCEVSQR